MVDSFISNANRAAAPMADPFNDMSPAEVAAIKTRLEHMGKTVTEKDLGITSRLNSAELHA